MRILHKGHPDVHDVIGKTTREVDEMFPQGSKILWRVVERDGRPLEHSGHRANRLSLKLKGDIVIDYEID